MGEREREQKTNRERERERKRVFQLAGKQARRRAEESKGRRRREAAHSTDWTLDLDISTHQLIVIALAHKLHTYFTQTEA